MNLFDILGENVARLIIQDQGDEDYINDNKSDLAIHCSGHYNVAELEHKLAQLKEANFLHYADQLHKELHDIGEIRDRYAVLRVGGGRYWMEDSRDPINNQHRLHNESTNPERLAKHWDEFRKSINQR